MATDDYKVRLENKRILPLDLLKAGLLDYLVKAVTDGMASAFANDAVIGATAIPVTATVATNNKIDVAKTGGPYKAQTGVGRLLNFSALDSRLQGIAVPPDAAQLYCVGLETALLDAEVEANPRTGEVQYRKQLESIGRVGTPDLVTDNGDGTLTFRVNSVTEASKDHTGRQVRVWLKAKSDGGAVGPCSAVEATAIETRTVAFASSNNSITTVGDFGQQALLGSRSTTASDYVVALIGPTVRKKTTEDLRNTAGCLFLADVTSVAASNPITTISTTDQRLAGFDLADLADVLRRDSHGFTKVRVKADSSDSSEPQIQVVSSSGSQVAVINETGLIGCARRTVTPLSLNDVPLDWFTDSLGNTRSTIDHLGLRTGPVVERVEDFVGQAEGNSIVTVDATALVGSAFRAGLSGSGAQLGFSMVDANASPTKWNGKACRIDPALTNGGRASLETAGPILKVPGGSSVVIAVEWLAALDTVGTNDQNVVMGFFDLATAPRSSSTNAVFFKRASADTNWLAQVVTAGTPSSTSTAVAPTTAAQRFRLEVHGAGSAAGLANSTQSVARFFIDGLLKVEIVGIPSASWGLGMELRNTAGLGAARPLWVSPIRYGYGLVDIVTGF